MVKLENVRFVDLPNIENGEKPIEINAELIVELTLRDIPRCAEQLWLGGEQKIEKYITKEFMNIERQIRKK